MRTLLLIALATLALAACGTPSDPPVQTDAGEASAPATPSLAPTSTPTPAGGVAPPTPTATPENLAERVPTGGRGRFVVLDNPAFLPASTASYLQPGELGLGLDIEGEARAYPISMMFFHHIINDTVQGRPITVTY
jgi:hypothetical protein